jgi:TrmH family RNA methyltransferase
MTVERHISSRSHALVKDLRRLAQDPGAYRKLGRVWLEGDHLCSALRQRGGLPAAAVISAAAWEQPTTRALALAAPEVFVLDDALMADISSLESPAPIGYLIPAPAMGDEGVRPDSARPDHDRAGRRRPPGSMPHVVRFGAVRGSAVRPPSRRRAAPLIARPP